jgi:hypothetical protein
MFAGEMHSSLTHLVHTTDQRDNWPITGHRRFQANFLSDTESPTTQPESCGSGKLWVMGHRTRIMYIERKAGNLTGPARIGRVTYSKTGATIYYGGREFRSLKGAGFKANYYDVETGEEYWISGPRRDGCDALYATNVATEIDEDVRQEYWTQIRKVKTKLPSNHVKVSGA